MGYKQGIDYAVEAFQAVNAADLKGGQTIHHFFGITMQKDQPMFVAVSVESAAGNLNQNLIVFIPRLTNVSVASFC